MSGLPTLELRGHEPATEVHALDDRYPLPVRVLHGVDLLTYAEVRSSTMSKHWTMMIEMIEVTPPEPIREGNGYAAKVNVGQGMTMVATTDRQKLERLRLVISADTEEEAYRKVIALLEVNRPQPTESIDIHSGDGSLISRRNLITPRPIRDNPQA
jgi:hypothetical protein